MLASVLSFLPTNASIAVSDLYNLADVSAAHSGLGVAGAEPTESGVACVGTRVRKVRRLAGSSALLAWPCPAPLQMLLNGVRELAGVLGSPQVGAGCSQALCGCKAQVQRPAAAGLWSDVTLSLALLPSHPPAPGSWRKQFRRRS